MSTYSHSRLECFEQCPLKFKFHYLDKIETEVEETVEAFLGSRVHETLEKLYKNLKFQKMPALGELLDFFSSEWKKNWNDAIIIVRKEYEQENFRKMGEKFITDYYNRYKPFSQARTIALETERTVEIDNEKKHRFHIRIDRLASPEDGVYEIHDYKTNNNLPIQEDLDKDEQLALYAYGVKKMYPDAKKVELVWHFLAFDKEMRSSRTEEQLEKLRNETLKLIEHVEGCKEFPARESALCEWCEYRPECPRFKHLYEIEDKTAEEYLLDNGVRLVNEYARANEEFKHTEEKLEKLRQALIKLAKAKGIETVYGSDVKAWVRSYLRLSFPKKDDPDRKAFIETLKKIGLWDKLATVDVYELAAMINRRQIHEELLKLIKRFISEGETNVVRLGRK